MVAREHNESSRGQEDIMPDNPLKEAVMGLWYNASVPKPNIKVVFVQMTLIFFTDRSRHPYGILRPFFDPVVDVDGHVGIHCEAQGLCILARTMVAAIHPALLGSVIHCWGVAGDGCRLHEPGVCEYTFVIPLQGTNGVNRHYLAQGAG